jgi:hypothetical protein
MESLLIGSTNNCVLRWCVAMSLLHKPIRPAREVIFLHRKYNDNCCAVTMLRRQQLTMAVSGKWSIVKTHSASFINKCCDHTCYIAIMTSLQTSAFVSLMTSAPSSRYCDGGDRQQLTQFWCSAKRICVNCFRSPAQTNRSPSFDSPFDTNAT